MPQCTSRSNRNPISTFVCTLLVGCALDAEQEPVPAKPPDQDQVASDREECKHAGEIAAEVCPRWWAKMTYSGNAAHDFVELEDVAEPLCNGNGLYATPEDFEGALGGPEITIVRNSQCSIVCMPQCAFTSVCYAENPDGEACGHACMPPGLTKEQCAAFVAECLGDPSACD